MHVELILYIDTVVIAGMDFNTQSVRTIRMFVIGGTLLALAEYIANHLQNPSLAAIASFLPISLITCYFVIGRNNMITYQMASIWVCVGTLFVYTVAHQIMRNTDINRHILITMAIGLWAAIQYASYQYRSLEN